MTTRKLLIAEDDPASRELLREILETQGYQVVEAEDGQAALRRIEEESPDLVLLDIQMPKLDGLAVVRRLRQNPRLTSLPVIADLLCDAGGQRKSIRCRVQCLPHKAYQCCWNQRDSQATPLSG